MQLYGLAFRLYFKQHHQFFFCSHLKQTLLFKKVSQNSASPIQGPKHHYTPQACFQKSYTAMKRESSNARGLADHIHFSARIKHKIRSVKLFSSPTWRPHDFLHQSRSVTKRSLFKYNLQDRRYNMLQTCSKDHRGLPGGQALLTLPSQLVSLTTGELKQAENWLRLKCVEKKRTNSSFPPQLDSGLLSAITSSPVQETSGSHPHILGWIYTEISQDPNMLRLPWKSKHMLQPVGFQNWVLATKSEYLRSLYKIYCPPLPQKAI